MQIPRGRHCHFRRFYCDHLIINDLVKGHNLEQVVTRPTRQNSILDYIITNLKPFYKTPGIYAPLGSSDHNMILWTPKDISRDNNNNNTCINRTVRPYPQSVLSSFGLWSSRNEWFSKLESSPSSNELALSFTNDLKTTFDNFFPVKTIISHPTDKPWIGDHIKQLIKTRQRAFHTGDVHLWRQYRWSVQKKIRSRKNIFMPKKSMTCGRTIYANSGISSIQCQAEQKASLNLQGQLLSEPEIVESLNDYFVTVASDIPPLDFSSLPAFLLAAAPPPTLHPHEVCNKLLKLRTNKAMGLDNIPSRILKEFAYELTEPITLIFNTSLSSGEVPALWKDSMIIPIPEGKQVQLESDARRIALTPVLSKVLEDFIVSWMIEDIGKQIDSRQFGSLKDTSTTYCLLDLVHNWLSKMDDSGRYFRACFLDFSEA